MYTRRGTRMGWLAALLGVTLSGMTAQGADFVAWGMKAKIRFAGYDKPETLANFPALVVLSTNITGFSYAAFQSGANADLRFTASDGSTELNYEIESWDVDGASYVWVQVPALADANTAIWAYWGKSGVSAPAYTSNGATWADGYAGVWHLDEAGGTRLDSTANANHGVVGGGTVSQVAGRVKNAVALSSEGYLNCGNSASLNLEWSEKYSMTAWIKSSSPGFGTFFGHMDRGGGYRGYDFTMESGAIGSHSINSWPSNAKKVLAGSGFNNDAWHHVAVVTDGTGGFSRFKIYVDGVAVTTTDANPGNSISGTMQNSVRGLIGGRDNAAGDFFTGSIDELHLARAERSANWVWAAYMNSGMNNAFNEYGPAEVQNVDLPRVANGGAQNLTDSSAAVAGTLTANGSSPSTVYLYWGTTDCTNNAAAWVANGGVAKLGAYADGQTFTNTLGSRQPSTLYYFNHLASNATGVAWGSAVGSPSFRTMGVPAVDNGAGATGILRISAVLNGNLTAGGTAHLYFRWGTDAGNLSNTNDLGVLAQGAQPSLALTGLTQGTTYYYSTYATNAYGADLEPVSSFTTLYLPPGVTNTWTGTGDWFADVGNWSGGVGAPCPGDPVIIASGSVSLTNSTPVLSALAVNGGTLTCANWATEVRATEVTVKNGATITCSGPFGDAPNMSNRVHVVCADFSLANGATLTVVGKGYSAGPGVGADPYQGAAHGGRGRDNWRATYGSRDNPETPGSGAVNGGVAGGGVVRIDASGTARIDGTINANGQSDGGGYGASGASGGSILINCGTFAGGGVLSARGSPVVPHGNSGGGGGRIAVHYAAASSPAVYYDLRGSYTRNGAFVPIDIGMLDGEMGTLYLSDNNFFLQETMNKGGGRFYIPGVTHWSPASLTVNNNTAIGFPEGFDLRVAGALVVGDMAWVDFSDRARVTAGSVSVAGGEMMLVNSNRLSVAGRMDLMSNARLSVNRSVEFSCGGDLVLTNATRFYLYSAPTSGGGADYGSRVEVGGTLTVASGASVYPFCDPVNGDAPLFRVGHLTVALGGTIDAVCRGYDKYSGPAPGNYTYYGGTHGGRGGNSSLSTYGSEQHPITAGSGGGTGAYATPGGGVVWIDATPRGRVVVDGTIDAGVYNNNGHYSGKGAGGSIQIECSTFAGSGSLYARGGSDSGTETQGGGGGRIAIWRTFHAWTGVALDRLTLTAGGIGNNSTGEAGTLYLGYIPPPGTVIIIR